MEYVIVGIIIAAAVAAMAYFTWRSITGRGGCGCCGKKPQCPHSNDTEQE